MYLLINVEYVNDKEKWGIISDLVEDNIEYVGDKEKSDPTKDLIEHNIDNVDDNEKTDIIEHLMEDNIENVNEEEKKQGRNQSEDVIHNANDNEISEVIMISKFEFIDVNLKNKMSY